MAMPEAMALYKCRPDHCWAEAAGGGLWTLPHQCGGANRGSRGGVCPQSV